MLHLSQLEPYLFCLDLMDQTFDPAKNESSKFILLKHSQSIRLKSSKHVKMSASIYISFGIRFSIVVGAEPADSDPTLMLHQLTSINTPVASGLYYENI